MNRLNVLAMFKESRNCWLLAILLLVCTAALAQEAPIVVPQPTVDNARTPGALQKAVLAGGCYWGTQGVFEHVKGIKRIVAGFSGGRSDSDGGAESVMITFDPNVISYGQLLQIFFSVVHDPTQLNRQGPDQGAAYRSNIFYVNEEQQRIAQAYIAQLDEAGVFPGRIVTRLDAFVKFNQVEISQQDFMIKNPHLDYIVVNDVPKLASLKRLFPSAYRDSPLQFRE